MPPNQNAPDHTTTTNDNLYAVLIVTQDAEQWPGDKPNRFWYDVSVVYNTLIQVYGYSDDNIYVHYYDGTSPRSHEDLDDPIDNENHFDYPASKSRILETFNNLSGEWDTDLDLHALGPSDQLFVYVDGHGKNNYGHSTIICKYPGYEYLNDDELADAVEEIDCAQMIFLFQPCNSGNFAYKLTDYNYYDVACKNRIVHTSTSLDLYSTSEYYLTGNRYTEFTFYWTAAVRGFYPVFLSPWIPSEYATGSFPFDELYPLPDHPDDYNPDDNNDGFVQMEEAFLYADNFDVWSPNGYYHPNLPYAKEEPVNKNEMGCDNLTTLYGLAGTVENYKEIIGNRNYLVGNTLTVDNYLYILDNANLFISGENAYIDITNNGEMEIYQQVSFHGREIIVDGEMVIGQEVSFNNTDITVNGEIEIGEQVSFNNMDLFLNNNNLQTTFNNTTLTGSVVFNRGMELNVIDCNFNNCEVLWSLMGNVNITTSNFYCTWLLLYNMMGSSSNITNITYNNIVGDQGCPAGVFISDYDRFFVEHNYIEDCGSGIQIWESGDGITGNQNISNNTIYNNSISGISIYNSIASIAGNHIHNNNYGVRLFDRSNIALYGDPIAGTQQITDNTEYEVYASKQSFPWYFRYNEIIDEDNLGNPLDPLVYHDLSRDIYRDVRYNCWGNNFVAEEDLYPVNGYGYLPIWCPGQKDLPIPGPDEVLYTNAKDLFEAENYTQAKDSFQLLINQYPESHYSQAAMKDMFALEQFESNDYENLRDYFRTNDSIIADSSLAKLGDFMANKCDVKLENWQTAIYWYEDVIQNPESTEDSIFAIIDLGYTYFLMNNSGNKAGYTGKMLEHIPKSMKEFREKRDYLLSLLPLDKKNHALENSLETLKAGELSQNIPNPFSNTTTIYYKLFESGFVHIKVFNHLGIEVKAINEAVKEKGLHKVELNANDLPPGIYYYSLLINGKLSDTKKMVVVK